MKIRIHVLMENPHDDNAVSLFPVKDRMASVFMPKISLADMIYLAADTGLLSEEREAFFQREEICICLSFAKLLKRKNIDLGQVLISLFRQFVISHAQDGP